MASPVAFPVDDAVTSLVAHLPGSHVSPEAPSSVYEFLAPILRQRLKLLSGPSQADPWVSLLTWTPSGGAQLATHLSKLNIEPHPVSGEVEAGHVTFLGYRRLDLETLEAAVRLPEFEIDIVYHWISVDPDFECRDGWKVMDMHICTDEKPVEWFLTIFAAEEAFRKNGTGKVPAIDTTQALSPTSSPTDDDDDDDDDYWNSYDTADSHTPVPPKLAPSEEEYFSRFYGDSHDDHGHESQSPRDYSTSQFFPPFQSSETATEVSTPPASMPTASYQAPTTLPAVFDVSKLEESAVQIDQEIAIKQHISSTMKSLYRLAKATGMSRADYVAVIKTELSILPMLDDDE
ncbi:hypothetical protein EX30DRAFT_398612 [Ascodesmis nigricans]|uniref:Uncharacterized protein n=1 Tax=Ascodesmis nigricans TaxID=341454 RepID=A0A4S2MKM6_9PEZI|nr:hypothetical protein EX30DRAFT_398612 [Ascodesmis nigricans]